MRLFEWVYSHLNVTKLVRVKLRLIMRLFLPGKLYSNDDESKLKVAAQIDEACRTCGCFIVKNHHIARVNAPHAYNKKNKHTYRGYFPQRKNSNSDFIL